MSSRSKTLGWLMRLILVIGLAAIVVWNVDFGELVRHFTRRSAAALLAVQPLMLAAFAVTAFRYALLARQPPAPFITSFKAVILSVGLNLALPGRASELIKATYMRNRSGIALSAALSAIVIERLADAMIVGLIAMATLTILVVNVNWLAIAGIIVGGALALALLTRGHGLLTAIVSRLPNARLRLFGTRMLDQTSNHVRQGRFLRACALGVVIWAASFSAIACVIAWSGGAVSIGIGGMLAVFVATTIGGAIPALPAGLGTYEGAAVLCLGQFGFQFEEALALAIIMHATQFVLSAPLAMLIVMVDGVGIADLMRQAAAARGRSAETEPVSAGSSQHAA